MVKKGDNYLWGDGKVAVQVTRVASDDTWADITCQALGNMGMYGYGKVWCKRQPLPFPDSFVFQGISE